MHSGNLYITNELILADHSVKKDGNIDRLFIIAVKNGHVRLVDYFLELGTNANFQDESSNTALIYSAEYGHVKVAERSLKGVIKLSN